MGNYLKRLETRSRTTERRDFTAGVTGDGSILTWELIGTPLVYAPRTKYGRCRCVEGEISWGLFDDPLDEIVKVRCGWSSSPTDGEENVTAPILSFIGGNRWRTLTGVGVVNTHERADFEDGNWVSSDNTGQLMAWQVEFASESVASSVEVILTAEFEYEHIQRATLDSEREGFQGYTWEEIYS